MNKEIKLKRIVTFEKGFVNKVLWLLVGLLLLLNAFAILSNEPTWKVFISFILVAIGIIITSNFDFPKIEVTYKVVK